MSSNIHKKEFTEVGELEEIGNDLYIKLRFGKSLKRILKPLKGKKLEVGFKILKYQRSKAQNRYLWGVAYITIRRWFKDTQGENVSKDAIHAHTLQHILGYDFVTEEVMGHEVIVTKGKSTSALNTQEFNELVEKLQAYWGEKGCYIQDPRENNFLSDFIKDD